MIRKILAAVTASLMMLVSVNCYALSNGPLDLKIGQTTTESGAYYTNDALYLELEPVCKLLGYTVTSTDPKAEIRLTNGSETIRIFPADNIIEANGHSIRVLDSSAEDTFGAGCMRLGGVLYMRADLLSDLFGLDVREDESENTVTVLRILRNFLTIDTERTNLTEGLLTAAIQYPVLSGPWNPQALETINGIFQQAADTALAQGRQNAKELENFASVSDSSHNSSLQCSTYFDYAVKYNQNGLLSIVLTNYQYAGGAHGSTIQTAYTFDLNTGHQLTLSDLMKSGSGYEEFFDEQVRKEIDKRVKEGSLYEFQDNPFQTLGEHPNFYLSDDGIVFYFQQYEYFPYVAGIQEFPISYESIANLLNPSYSYLYQKQNRIA
ncbi:MAG: DUF3298 domain-containing protein [Oscillospiraceae bacterium]|jgi:hypothetical protein